MAKEKKTVEDGKPEEFLAKESTDNQVPVESGDWVDNLKNGDLLYSAGYEKNEDGEEKVKVLTLKFIEYDKKSVKDENTRMATLKPVIDGKETDKVNLPSQNLRMDLSQYQGAEYDVWFCDEAGQFQESWIMEIDACVRGVNEFPKRSYYTLNPGGPSHGYFKRVFIDRKFKEGENPEDYAFIQALCTDNEALMKSQPQYIEVLKRLPQKLQQAWLYGRWDIFEGQFFEDFRDGPDTELCKQAGITREQALRERRFTHVIEPFDLNAGSCRGWNLLRSYDFGYAKPFSVGYWAIDYEGTLYRILELYGCTGEPNEGVKWTPEEQFKAMAELESTHPWLKGRKFIDSIADPAIFDASRGESIAQTAARYGIYWTPGDHHRIPGWMQVHYRLQFDQKGYPRMYVFQNCKAFIRTFPLQMYSQTNPEDLNTDLEDHCPDEVRYLCMSRPVAPILEQPRKSLLVDPLS